MGWVGAHGVGQSQCGAPHGSPVSCVCPAVAAGRRVQSPARETRTRTVSRGIARVPGGRQFRHVDAGRGVEVAVVPCSSHPQTREEIPQTFFLGKGRSTCFSRRSPPLPWRSRHLRLVDPPCGTTVPWFACRPPRSCRSLDTLRMKSGSSGWTCQPSARKCALSAGAFATRRVRQTWSTFAGSAVGRACAAPSASRRWACL